MQETEKNLLNTIAGIRGFQPGTAFNLRQNGLGVERHSTSQVQIKTKTDQPGIDIMIKAHTAAEEVHIPVILTESGIKDDVYNDFYIGEGENVTIIACCVIHNDGCETSQLN